MPVEKINGWIVLQHPLFEDQLNELQNQAVRQKSVNAQKRFAAVVKLMTQDIPADPSHRNFRLGQALGASNRHWFRAKFFMQYRLFFRFDSKSKIIILVWINDEATKRAYDSKTDAYVVFEKMLASGNPPSSFIELLNECQKPKSKPAT